jgi:rhamnogalacturonyl hydrolase YesR
MSENKIPYIGSDGFYHMDEEEQKLWDNTLMDGLENLNKEELIDKVRNYYNTCYNIDGRPPSKLDFNEFLNTL